MNVKERNDLWLKIKNFPLDEEGAAINFSQKLTTQQKWSPAFTVRVIEEYRRFILLCVFLKAVLLRQKWWTKYGTCILPTQNLTG